MVSSFDKQFPAKGCYCKDVREFRRQGWLAALKWTLQQSCDDDIEQEIEAIERNKK